MLYLDHAATTKVCPEAAQAALAAMSEDYGNPSSVYPFGKRAAELVKSARSDISAALGCLAEEVFFTSCGTEGDNWAIRGAVELNRRRGKHIITTAIEHSAVLEPIKALAREGYEVTYLKPDRTGHVSIDELGAALRPDTVLVSIMLVNNELGTIQDVAGAAKAIKASGVPALLHTDAVQAFLKVPFTPKELGVDLLTVSGHKVRAPKGIGALYLKKGLKLPPMLLGGGQESGLRPGTEPTAQIAAFAAACRAWDASYPERILSVKNYALEILCNIPGIEILSPGDAPHILALSIPAFSGQSVVEALGSQGVCVSSGSACHRGKPSHVFAAMPLSPKERLGALRVSFGPDSTRDEVDELAGLLRQMTENQSLLFGG